MERFEFCDKILSRKQMLKSGKNWSMRKLEVIKNNQF